MMTIVFLLFSCLVSFIIQVFGSTEAVSYTHLDVYKRQGVTLSAHTSLCTWPILHLANEEQKQRWLPRLASGESLGALGLTEPSAGSDVGATAMTAVRDGDDYILNGTKIFITNGYYADIYLSLIHI